MKQILLPRDDDTLTIYQADYTKGISISKTGSVGFVRKSGKEWNVYWINGGCSESFPSMESLLRTFINMDYKAVQIL